MVSMVLWNEKGEKKNCFQKRKDDNNQFKERPSVVKRLSRVALGTDVTTEHIYLAPDEQEWIGEVWTHQNLTERRSLEH